MSECGAAEGGSQEGRGQGCSASGQLQIQCGNSTPPHSGTPPWGVHIAVLLHLCISAVATGTFKSNYVNFRSLEIIKFGTF